MSDGSDVIASKLANALIPDAQPTAVARVLSGGVLKLFKKGFGGLWVGGTVTLTRDTLAFAANAMNRALHVGLTDIEISLARIQKAADRFGVVTRIVDVHVDDGTVFTFRCYGATDFANKIMDAARRAR